MQQGRLYYGDGRSHMLEFKVNGRRNGEEDLKLKGRGTIRVEGLVAALLDPQAPPNRVKPLNVNWHLENARIGTSRDVAVELVVNGEAVDKTIVKADGTPQRVQFKTTIERSSWVALRIFASVHTYPVFIEVGGKPVRASRRSAQWCRDCIDKLWEVKQGFIRESERPAAAAAFDYARRTYEKIITECEV